MSDALVIIPAYNEEASIGRTLSELVAERLDVDVLVVNDGSIDNTASIVRSFPVFLIQHPVNLGYGAALQSGYKFAARGGYQYVIQFDADGQHDIKDLRNLLTEVRKNDADIVIGSRYLGNPDLNLGRKKTLAIKAFRLMIRFLTKQTVTDPTSGLRAMSAKLFGLYAGKGQFPADFPDADIIIHMLLYRFKLREFPIGSRQRESGVSMHSGLRPIIYMFKVLLSILAVWVNYALIGRRKIDVQQ